MTNNKVVHASNDNWNEEVMKSELPVLADFWAEWCGPCKTLGRVLDELADELQGRIKIVKVNVDQNHDLAQQFSVRALPTLLVLKDGVVQEQMVGGRTKLNILSSLEKHL